MLPNCCTLLYAAATLWHSVLSNCCTLLYALFRLSLLPMKMKPSRWGKKNWFKHFTDFMSVLVECNEFISQFVEISLEKTNAPVMGTQFRQSPSARSWIKIKPGVWKCHRKRLKISQCLKTVIYALKSEMYKRANKRQCCAQNCHIFKIQSLDLAKSDVRVTVNICTVYDKNQIAQNLAVSIQHFLYYTSINTHTLTVKTQHV